MASIHGQQLDGRRLLRKGLGTHTHAISVNCRKFEFPVSYVTGPGGGIDCPDSSFLYFRFSNTVGDVSGCPFDMHVSQEDVIILRASIKEEDGSWKAIIGDHQVPESEHYILAYADQTATLDKAWNAVKQERLANPNEGGYKPVDEDMKRGWHVYAELADHLLGKIWDKRAEFPEESLIWLEKARNNLVNGPWSKYCEEEQ